MTGGKMPLCHDLKILNFARFEFPKRRPVVAFARLKKTDSIFVAGHRGLAGGAIYRELQQAGYSNLLTRTRAEVDLRQRESVRACFAERRPQVVVVAAAKVGGIKANNDFPVEFLIENLAIQNNLIEAAHEHGAEK